MTARDVIRKLRRAGFVFDRQAKGSHEIYYNPKTKRRVTVPAKGYIKSDNKTIRAYDRRISKTVKTSELACQQALRL